METLRTIAMLLPLALTSGINFYATVLVVGACIRLELVQNVPAGLEILAAWPVIIVAGIFFLMEFLADKIPFVDNVWDAIHTVVRPLGAAVLGFAVVAEVNPVLAVLAALVMGSIAFVSHSGKAGSRIALNVASPAENVSNVALSLAEDAGVVVLSFMALTVPFVAAGIAILLLVLIVLLVPRLLRWTWFTFKALLVRLKGFVHQVRQSDPLPPAHLALVQPQQARLTASCRGQNLQGANGRGGYLSLVADALLFSYDKRGGSQVWRLPLEQIGAVHLRHRALMDVLEVQHRDARQRERVARFVFMKDRTALAERFATQLGTVAGGPSAPSGRKTSS